MSILRLCLNVQLKFRINNQNNILVKEEEEKWRVKDFLFCFFLTYFNFFILKKCLNPCWNILRHATTLKLVTLTQNWGKYTLQNKK